MILLIKHTAEWKLISQKNQTQINKYNILKNKISRQQQKRLEIQS